MEIEDIQEEETGNTEPVKSTEEETPIEVSEPEKEVIDEKTTFTQEDLNNIVKERLERDRKTFLERYHVESKESLDELIGKAQIYDALNEKFQAINAENETYKERLLFIDNKINPEREDDIRVHFKGKELPMNEENLAKELETHPEWKTQEQKNVEHKKSTIEIVGKTRDPKPEVDERAEAAKLFGFENGFVN